MDVGKRVSVSSRQRLGFLATVLVLLTASAWGHSAETDQLKVQLISDTDAVQPGSALLVGLRFEMQKQWHIYWRNPGDSGEPPQVRWKLPAGFRAGEVQWPAPERLGSGSVIDYGYRGSVLLPVVIQTPRTALAAASITLSAEVSWLVCKDICVPGQADLTLSLPVRMAPAPVSASHPLFQEAGSRLPKPMPPAWRIEATSEPAFFVLTVQGAGVGNGAFFPFEADQIDHAAPQTTTVLPDGVRLVLKKSDQLAKTPARLDGVLELGSGQVYALSVPVRSRPGRSAPP
jgi:thiol:disulfide interchange protein DsbD